MHITRTSWPESRHEPARLFARTVVMVTLLLAAAATGEAVERLTPYSVEIRLLGGWLRFDLAGQMRERMELGEGRYETRAHGRGTGVETIVESAGILRDGRWAPLRTRLYIALYGRHWSSEAVHHPEARTVEYRARGESFFLRQPYTSESVLPVPAGVHLDDVVSALLNYAQGRWPAEAEGRYTTHFVRRGRATPAARASTAYGARLRPVVVTFGGQDGATVARVDLQGLTTWALPDHPARVRFGADRRPHEVTLPLKLGTSVLIRLGEGGAPAASAPSVARP